jgi:hypothetical protein
MKKTIPLIITLLIGTTAIFNIATAQGIVNALKTLKTSYRQEKLYVQLDRSIYSPGETIWFKAYLFDGNFPSQISKTIYTELTDAKGNLLHRNTMPVIMSAAAGSMEIPKTFAGTVILRAYTKWMLNFDSSYLYTRAISVIPGKRSADTPGEVSPSKSNPVTIATKLVIQFFPEGGDLVQEVESRVAFKATNNRGRPYNLSGEILDSRGLSVTTFESIHDGMGSFLLTPKEGERYRASWKDAEGNIHEKNLPSFKPNGIVLETEIIENKVVFKIKHAPVPAPWPFVYVAAQINQQLIYKGKANIAGNEITSSIIPIENVPAGIMQVTVFTPDEKPIAERIVFVNLADCSFETRLNSSLTDKGKRKKNTINIEVTDTLACNLSIAVTDAGLNPMMQEGDIFSTLLLTGEIKGYIHNPAYYFSGNADSVANYLDLVMMTNGWRRFNWEAVLAGQFPNLTYLPENYISVDGQVSGINKKELEGKEINGIIEFKDKKKGYLNTIVQPEGKFSFAGLVFFDTAKLFYQFNRDKKKTLTEKATFVIESNLLNDPLKLNPDHALMAESGKSDNPDLAAITSLLQHHNDEMELHKPKVLQTIILTSHIKTKQELMDEEYTSGFFSDNAGGMVRTILPEDDPSFLASQNLFNYLQNRVAGLQVNFVDNDVTVNWRGFATSLFVDEIPQTALSFEAPVKLIEDPSYIMSISMSEIAMVKIYDPVFFGSGSASSGGQGGAISVYLKRAGSASQVKGLEYISLAGYSPIKEFYSPDYSMPDRNDIPDYRATLYWNPYIITGKNNHDIQLSFYNNDFTKNMKVIIEGCNAEGKLTRIEKIF